MTKARILANLISDNAELADGQISVAEVVGAAPLASPDFTGTLSLAGTDLTPDFAELNHVNGVTSAIQTQIDTKAPSASPTFTGTVTTDVLNIDEASLLAIAASITDTAVDVFVYRTANDSDGGKWRHRTQATSWYNETLNTGTRGSRKEFPAVAVIVLEAREITIYDGDDPDMPMWMVFNIGTSGSTNSKLLGYEGSSGFTSVAALNGILTFGDTLSVIGVFKAVNFISDSAFAYNATVSYYASYPLVSGNWVTGIGSRNTHGGYAGSSVTPVVVNADINDVAMTVLPNAPIDAATGLPVPTIAVATDGGVSVIRDDGTVVDITDATDAFGTVEFTQTNRLIIGYKAYTGMMVSGGIPVADTTRANWSSHYYQNTSVPALTGGAAKKVAEYNFGDSYGLTLLKENETSMAQGSVAYITSSYSTGHMVGDIKLATLSDTDDTNVTGGELVTNGTFASDTAWSKESNWSIGSGVATSTGSGYLHQALSITNQTITITVDVTSNSGTIQLQYYDGSFKLLSSRTGTGTLSATLDASLSTNKQVYIYSTAAATIDNVTARLAEEDRSVNGNGLQVFGSITKTAVATGADLVGYSGFSASNYLQQPYNSDLDFGTGDFSYMFWSKNTGGEYKALYNRTPSGTTGGILLQVIPSGHFELYVSNNTNWTLAATVTNSTLASNTWVHLVVKRTSSVIYIYYNGVLQLQVASAIATTNLTRANALATVGVRSDGSSPSTGSSIALFRASATAPSPEQIAKIYNDEKHLFQENAQATLYAASPASGSPDAVTALAYDDSTDLLHVGTDNGRSVFQGLRRVDNTTDAVGAAISASNGLVAED